MNRTVPAPVPEAPHQWLSDLADGRLDGEALERACQGWAADAEARRTWHAYHLIGDVLRSDDLAPAPGRDEAFLAGVRARLAAEPVVLAPAATPAPAPVRRRRQVWLAPVAAAAGFVAVAGVVVVLRQAEAPAGGAQLAAGQPLAVPVRADPASERLRQLQMEAYLRAHREALAGAPAALPGGGVRTVEFTPAPR